MEEVLDVSELEEARYRLKYGTVGNESPNFLYFERYSHFLSRITDPAYQVKFLDYSRRYGGIPIRVGPVREIRSEELNLNRLQRVLGKKRLI